MNAYFNLYIDFKNRNRIENIYTYRGENARGIKLYVHKSIVAKRIILYIKNGANLYTVEGSRDDSDTWTLQFPALNNEETTVCQLAAFDNDRLLFNNKFELKVYDNIAEEAIDDHPPARSVLLELDKIDEYTKILTAELDRLQDITLENLKGESAYQTWLKAGNVGTEQDFLMSLKVSEDIQEYESVLTFPNIGKLGIIYYDKKNNATYRWSNKEQHYIVIGANYRDIQVINGGMA